MKNAIRAIVLGLMMGSLVPIAGSAASHTEFRFRNMTSFVAQIDVEQITPVKKTLGFIVNPRRTETRYLSDPMGRFSVHGIAYVGGQRDKLKPFDITIRPGSVVTIVLDDADDGFSLTVSQGS